MKIDMLDIEKSFGSNDVLKQVSFSLSGGDICALLGENGAGKSTLMNILGGIVPLDSGQIMINGKAAHFRSPADSQNAGIAFIHQELNLINDLPIYENMFLGRELKTKYGFLDAKKMIRKTEEIFAKMDIGLDPRTEVGKLDSSYKQIVEICRALLSDAEVIIMDEPTTSLTDQEVERVFKMMKSVQRHGVGIIFISHKLNEVMEICTRYTVLRDGKRVAEGAVGKVKADELARHMVGYDVRTEPPTRKKNIGDEVLAAEDLTYKNVFRDVTFSVRAGEIVGFTGLLGDGRSELFQTIFGMEKPSAGMLSVNGERVSIEGAGDAIRRGIAYLPRNRKENAIIKHLDIFENASIASWPKFSRHGLINRKKHKELFGKHRSQLRLKMGKLTDSIESLSGGNQQKVMIAKWLAAEPQILILDNPTQGVDVGAKEDIYDIIMKLAEDGIAVIVLSSEAKEIIRICDRAVVMYHGRIQGETAGEKMNEHAIMTLATGGRLSG